MVVESKTIDAIITECAKDEASANKLRALFESNIEALTVLYEEEFTKQLEQERTDILSDFIRDTTHEFRTPLSSIRTKAHNIQRKYPDILADESELQEIGQKVDQISQLIDKLALMSDLDKRNSTTMRGFLLHTILADIVTVYQTKFEGIIHVELADVKSMIFAAETLLMRAIREILDNAIKFTPADGVITIRTRGRGSKLFIEIHDTGIGMSPETVLKARNRFFRMDDAGTSRGFGLGLSIAQRIAEMHNSNLDIESELGVGTTVRMDCVLIGSGIF